MTPDRDRKKGTWLGIQFIIQQLSFNQQTYQQWLVDNSPDPFFIYKYLKPAPEPRSDNSTRMFSSQGFLFWEELDQSHNSCPILYPAMHHFGTEMCQFLFQYSVLWDIGQVHCEICSVPQCIVWYRTGALWDLWDWSIHKPYATFYQWTDKTDATLVHKQFVHSGKTCMAYSHIMCGMLVFIRTAKKNSW